MKGPYERLKYDFRRVWECPVCHHRESSTGARSSMLCKCQQAAGPKAVWMRMAEEAPRRIDGKTPQTVIAAILKTLQAPVISIPEVVPEVVIAAEAAMLPPDSVVSECLSSETLPPSFLPPESLPPEVPASTQEPPKFPASSEPRLQDPT